ncbi:MULTISPECIES: PepSY domain-containing protein [unclassified Massilia]|uniref:PepSY-associated TM helix domain-containing protein n=1 Tax=unclassified Massilia TaxID=2609279 RepID=UPI00177F90B5|nr:MULTISPECIES: PepSY domain-containing protein [unclassified Massilia]MBD8533088.1 PepSY domain-containing protein [Massilia sp. CFBP 13647]MBD8676555.1 PepSY domain-containing protein [Massilia sp. CFBP 13721]
MSSHSLRRWSWIHKWSSLVCTVFMLLLCLTGLPLIYHHEIGHLLGNDVEAPALAPELAANPPRANLDDVIAAGRALYPNKIMMYMSQESDEPRIWNVTLGDHPNDEHYKPIAVDARTAKVITEPAFEGGAFMSTMFRLHVDLFAGLPGKLFLGFMGLLLIVAIVSGVVLYAPFMRKQEFGTVRHGRTSRLKWLDLHNLLGIVTLVWALVVGATGMVNTWADVLLKYWQATEIAAMLEPYKGAAAPTKLASMEQAVRAAEAASPGMAVGFVAFPGTPFASPHHYGVYMRGNEAFSSRLYKPVLIDAQTGAITDHRDLPWYLTALLISQPLHFGDYGGAWMKLLWALLDVATIVVLGSGLYLWVQRGRAVKRHAQAVAQAPAMATPVLARSGEGR